MPHEIEFGMEAFLCFAVIWAKVTTEAATFILVLSFVSQEVEA